MDPKTRDHKKRKKLFRECGANLKEIWLRRIGPILGKKIVAGDGEFFRQLGDAVDEFSKESRQIESVRRYLAVDCKLYCDITDTPFTCKALRDYYKRHNPADDIDSSTLSKMRRWARSSEMSFEGVIQRFGPPRIRMGPINRPINRIL